MTNGTKFVDQDELEGRTVAKVFMDRYNVLIAFKDGTFTKIAHGGGWYTGEGEMYFDDEMFDEDWENLAKVGITKINGH